MNKRGVLAGIAALALVLTCAFGCLGCSAQQESEASLSSSLTYESSMQLEYATGFSVDYYSDGYKLITIADEGRFLVVPEGSQAPSDLASDVVVIQQPVQHGYLAASAAMDFFRAIDGIGSLRLTSTQQSDWYVEEAAQAMEEGKLLYAGKYSMPDYELVLSEGCDLVVESTMIYHSPDVKEALESYGIPVLVDQSSYEEHPLGRSEWVKLYGALLNCEDAATAAFDEQKTKFEQVTSDEALSTSPTVAFFYINSNGGVNVRRGDDYVAKMIEMAGGTYVFSDLVDESTSNSSQTLQMETFYAQAKDADILIYNATVEGALDSLDDLVAKSEFLADFTAVKNGTVWCTDRSMYQDSMELGDFISDVHKILADPNVSDSELTYLYRLS